MRFTDSIYTSTVWNYSFNEWYEGAGIEQLAVEGPDVGPPFAPGYPYDFGQQLLQVLKQRLP